VLSGQLMARALASLRDGPPPDLTGADPAHDPVPDVMRET
jgi:hypothetical protein